MKKNIFRLIILTILLSTIAIAECHAFAGLTVNYISSNSSNNSDDADGDGIPTYTNSWEEGTNITYSCSADYNISVGYGNRIYGYNQDNQEIIEGEVKTDEDIAAGTAIGLNIVESKIISWEISNVTLTKTTKTSTYLCNCKKTVKICPDFWEIQISSLGWFKIPFLVIQRPGRCYDSQVSCTPGSGAGCTCQTCGGNVVTEQISSGEKYNKCKEDAEKYVKTKASGYEGSSYTLRLRNSNDINDTNITNNITGSGGCTGTNPRTCTYKYSPKTVCMNVLTSEVNYTNNDACGDNEIQVKDDSNHWHYFIPLNTKENDDFAITMAYTSQSGLQDKDFCAAAIRGNPTNYKDFIRDRNNKKLTGLTIEKDIETVGAGCYFGTEINITTEQKFYNEIEVDDDTTKFNGFNFYYKPITVNVGTNEKVENVVFPNGMTETSLWKEWYESEKKTLDLTKSYDTITYTALNIDVNKIRIYNQNNPYTDWSNMNIDGISKYIDNSGIIKRNNNVNVYKLGCGLANEGWSDCK